MTEKKIVVLTGAGVSAESGIPTFRDSGGLWEGYDVMEVASPEGWKKNPELVLNFYNERRKKAHEVEPNNAHKRIADLEEYFNVVVITQNIDNLHEKAGSSKVIHLHGNLFQARSTVDPSLIYDLESWEINIGDKCEKGSQLRPHIVWFGELVPEMDNAINEARQGDIFLVVGTSMIVYPAAGLINYAPAKAPKYIVDPNMPQVPSLPNLHLFEEKGTTGMEKVYNELIQQYCK